MHILAARDPAMSCLDSPHVSFQVIVGARQVLDIVASEQPPPAVAEGLINVSGNPSIFFIRVSRYFGEQLGQVVVNGLGNTLAGEWRLVGLL
jgi:hypothetical protein